MKFIWFSGVVAVLACATVGRNVDDTMPRMEKRIVNGKNARIEDYPYQVSLPMGCGGSILSSRVIITAAHCTIDLQEKDVKVYAGSSRRLGGAARDVYKIINHENYNRRTIEYDVSLLILTEPLIFSNTIQPIGLPEEDLRVGELTVATGWGSLYVRSPLAVILQTVDLPIMDQNKCAAKYEYLKLTTEKLVPSVTSRMLCAGENVQNAGSCCGGDSGGPLASNGKLYGITSWGGECKVQGFPTVFTRVTAVLPWIESKINLYK